MNRIISSWGFSSLPGEKSRGGFEDLVRAPGFSELTLEALVFLLHALAGRRWCYLVAVAVAPHAQGLLAYAQLRATARIECERGPPSAAWRSKTIRTARSRS